jgi:hypothetical protein
VRKWLLLSGERSINGWYNGVPGHDNLSDDPSADQYTCTCRLGRDLDRGRALQCQTDDEASASRRVGTEGGQDEAWTSRHASRHRLPSLIVRLDRAVRQFSSQTLQHVFLLFFVSSTREISAFYTTLPLTSGHTWLGMTREKALPPPRVGLLEARHTLCCEHSILNS